MMNVRSSHLQMFFKIGALKNFVIFTGKHRVEVIKQEQSEG